MWQEAKANDRRIKELMVDHRKRAERRRAYFDSRLGDPQQLIRVIGSASKVYPNAEQFYYHENTDNLMPWQGNPDIKIDRFDGRSLLDFVPEPLPLKRGYSNEDMADELNFERYHDLIEAERLKVTEAERLAEVEEEWTKLLDRHQAKLALLKDQEKPTTSSNNRGFSFDYGTAKVSDDHMDNEADIEKEPQFLKEVDILEYVDELTDKEKQILNDMSAKYGIRSYARLLRVAKKDRDSELRVLKRKQEEAKPKEGTKTSRRNERRRKRRRRERELEREGRYRRRYSPTYEPYQDDSEDDSESSEEDNEEDEQDKDSSDVVIEFGSNAPEENISTHHGDLNIDQSKSDTPATLPEKKLTPMEKLRLKMRAGLQKQIISDEKDRRQKEKEKEIKHLQDLAKEHGLPINAYLRPEPPTRETSEAASKYHSKDDGHKSPEKIEPNKERYRSPSSSPTRDQDKRYRSPSTDKSRSPSKKRYRSPSSPPKRRYRSPSGSRSPPKRRYRSPSGSRSPPRRHYRSSSSNRSRSRDDRKHNTSKYGGRYSASKRHRSPPSRRSGSRERHRSPPPRRSGSRDRHRSSRSSRYRSPSTDEERERKKYSSRSSYSSSKR